MPHRGSRKTGASVHEHSRLARARMYEAPAGACLEYGEILDRMSDAIIVENAALEAAQEQVRRDGEDLIWNSEMEVRQDALTASTEAAWFFCDPNAYEVPRCTALTNGRRQHSTHIVPGNTAMNKVHRPASENEKLMLGILGLTYAHVEVRDSREFELVVDQEIDNMLSEQQAILDSSRLLAETEVLRHTVQVKPKAERKERIDKKRKLDGRVSPETKRQRKLRRVPVDVHIEFDDEGFPIRRRGKFSSRKSHKTARRQERTVARRRHSAAANRLDATAQHPAQQDTASHPAHRRGVQTAHAPQVHPTERGDRQQHAQPLNRDEHAAHIPISTGSSQGPSAPASSSPLAPRAQEAARPKAPSFETSVKVVAAQVLELSGQ